jgi:hypothetical protein
MLADSAGGLKIQDLDATLEKVDEEAEKEFHNKVPPPPPFPGPEIGPILNVTYLSC